MSTTCGNIVISRFICLLHYAFKFFFHLLINNKLFVIENAYEQIYLFASIHLFNNSSAVPLFIYLLYANLLNYITRLYINKLSKNITHISCLTLHFQLISSLFFLKLLF